MKIFSFLFIIIAGVLVYFWQFTDHLTAFEKKSPYLNKIHVPETIGRNLDMIFIESLDDQSGIKQISLELIQGENVLSLDSTLYADPVRSHVSQPSLGDLHKTFKEGPAKIVLKVKDASFWGNEFTQEYPTTLDFKAPRISILSRQHMVVQGGSEFVLIEAIDDNIKEVGVSVDSLLFPAIPASEFDEAFEKSNVYAALFALPLQVENPKVRAYAKDKAGNITEAVVSFRTKPYRLRDTNPNVSETFVTNIVRPLFDEYVDSLSAEEQQQLQSTSDPVVIFKTVNENYRALLQKKIMALPLSINALPSGAFIKPMRSATTSNFGELRAYSVNGQPAGGSRHDGLDLASVLQDEVVASHAGIVTYSGSLGIYGETIIIDHGLGLTSLYGHLSSLSVTEGTHVEQGQEVGRSGATGLAGGDHLHFEFRVHNIPVTPIEWWDPNWIKDHVTGKIKAVKEQKGL